MTKSLKLVVLMFALLANYNLSGDIMTIDLEQINHIKDEQTRSLILASFHNKSDSILLTYKNSYVFFEFDKNDKVVYASSKIGILTGRLENQSQKTMKAVLLSLGDQELAKSDANLNNSVVDGMSVFVSSAKGIAYFSDVAILYINQNETFSHSFTGHLHLKFVENQGLYKTGV